MSSENPQPDSRPIEKVVIVSGMSGAGKSTALHALEDLGYFCVDNLPTVVVGQVIAACRAAGVRFIGLGIDVRVRAFIDNFTIVVDAIVSDPNVQLSVVFLDASDNALLNRFSATRRPHPLSTAADGEERGAIAVLDGVATERRRLAKVRARATDVIDTTALSVHELRRRVVELFGQGSADAHRMRIRLLSFGFKFGPPVDADLMLDVRFLANPYFVEELRAFTGLDEAVFAYVMGESDADAFLKLAENLIVFCLPRYEREGKAYLTIAVGCTGGRHRSVAMVRELGSRLHDATGMKVSIVHRDIDRESTWGRASEPVSIEGGARGTGGGV